MKSLKPKTENQKLITQKTADELKSEIEQLQDSLVDLQNQIASIETELNQPNVGRGSVNFDSVSTTTLNSTNSSLGAATFDTASGNTIEVDEIESRNITATNVIDSPHINTDDLDATAAEIDTLKVNTKVDASVVDAGSVTATTATLDEATVGTLNAATANISTYQVNKVDANEVETPLLKATESVLTSAAIDEAEIQDEVVMESEIVNLKNRNRYFKDDTNVIDVEASAIKPAYIEIDTKGVQIARIIAKDDIGELFSVIYSNARHTPFIQWSKRNDDCLNKMLYSENTNKLYLQTYSNSEIQWSIDGFEDIPHAVKTYSETMPEPIADCYRYNCGRKQGMVLMGDGEDGVVLSVQGTIEGNFLVDSSEFVYVNYYGNSAYDLIKIARAFFRNGSDEDGWKYEKAQVFGYIRHDDVLDSGHTVNEYTEVTDHTLSNYFTLSESHLDTPEVGYSVYIYRPTNDLYVLHDGEYVKVDYLYRSRNDSVDVGEEDGAFTLYADIEGDSNIGSSDSPWSFTYYTKSSTYIPTAHSPYRDEDNTEVEALEKIEMIDNNIVKLTVDSDYGQDEITIDCTDTVEDETLPFTLGFTVRTPRIDHLFNEDAPVIPGGRGSNDFNGQF